MAKRIKWVAVFLAVALAAAGCGQGQESGSAAAVPVDGNDSAVAAEKATVTFQVKFPEADGVGQSRLDDNTAAIYVEAWGDCGSAWAQLTAATATTTFELNPGQCSFYAWSQDGGGLSLDTTSASGILSSGTNTVILTFLRGEWSFVDVSEQPAPIILTGGETLAKFWLYPWETHSYASTAAIDPNKPVGWADYGLRWLTNTGTSVEEILGYDPLDPYRSETYFDMASQFQGGPGLENNANVVDGGWFNLTQLAGENYYYEDLPGDRLLAIVGMIPGDSPDEFTPDITPYLDSTIVDGTTMTGHIVELTFQSRLEEPANPTTGICEGGGDSAPLSPAAARTATLKAASTGVGKAATPIGNLTVVSNYCESVYNGTEWTYVEMTETSTWSDVYFHPFTAKASQLPVINWGSDAEVIVQKK